MTVDLSPIDENLLAEIANMHGMPKGAFNVRKDGERVERHSSAYIDISTKTDNPGIDIRIADGTKGETVYIPVIVTKSGLKDVVYNTFYVGENCDITIIAGCGIHNDSHDASAHDGIHSFYLGKNSRVRYVEKHYGEGEGTGERILNPTTNVYMEEGSSCELELVKLRGVTSTVRDTNAELGANAKLVLTEKLAAELGVRAGDAVTLTEQDALRHATGTSYAATVTGIVENYVYHYAEMGPALYGRLMGKAPDYRTVLAVTTSDPDLRVQFSNDLLAAGGVKTVAYNDETIDAYRDMMSSVNMIVVVLVTAAAALAFIVLYNLTNINITERIREIATIKVLGFRPKETASYVFRENVVLTALGTIVGLGAGICLHRFVIANIDVDMVTFQPRVLPFSFVKSILLTFVFMVIVDVVMYLKLERINMAESLKSVE